MARPVKKPPEQWREEILRAARTLFLSKGFRETSVADIMKAAGGAKGLFYRFFQSKEEAMQALCKQLFLDRDPFAAVRDRPDLNALQKMRAVLSADRSDPERMALNRQAVSILRDPQVLAAAVEDNRRVLTPLWLELLEEGRRDGSIQTPYAKELSELLPLINFWLLPSVFPATPEELCRKCRFAAMVLAAAGLPLMEEDRLAQTEAILREISASDGLDSREGTGREAPPSPSPGKGGDGR